MKVTKKLLGASVALAVAASLTVGTTFAWFTYQSNVQLGKVGFSVDSGDENLQVAVVEVGGEANSGDFVYSLSSAKIKEKINGGNGVTYKALTLAGQEISGGNVIDLVHKDETTKADDEDFAAFDLVFRYTPFKGIESYPSLVLAAGSTVTAGDKYSPNQPAAAWETIEAGRYGNEDVIAHHDELEARARDAARVAFIFGESTDRHSWVWAPSEAYGEGITSSNTSDTPKGFYLNNLASDYMINQDPEFEAVTAPNYLNRIYTAPGDTSQTNPFAHSTIVQFPAIKENATYSEFRMTVKVWLEGKDGDCLDSIFGDQFSFTLKFRTSTLKATTPTP